MTKIVTEKEVQILLMKKWRSLPCIWDTTHEFYYNQPLKQEAYESMLELWQKLEPDDGTIIGLKKKLECWRSAYKRELKKVEHSAICASTPDQVRKPKLWYYKYMTFLSRTAEDEEYEENEKDRTKEIEDALNDASKSDIDNFRSELWSVSEDRDDYATTYGLMLATQLRELDNEVRSEAKRLISEVVHQAQTGTLPEYVPQADLYIPKSGPSWYDVQPESEEQPVTTVDDSETITVKSEIDEAIASIL